MLANACPLPNSKRADIVPHSGGVLSIHQPPFWIPIVRILSKNGLVSLWDAATSTHRRASRPPTSANFGTAIWHDSRHRIAEQRMDTKTFVDYRNKVWDGSGFSVGDGR
jgi:hypothetical protein